MATQESMAIRSDAACTRIEAHMAEWGVKTAPLPRTHRDREMLRCNQLERIADMLDALQNILDESVSEAPKPKRKTKRVKGASDDTE